MGIEARSGRAYYYQKQRDGDQVRSIYVGPACDLLVQRDRLERERTATAQAQERQRRQAQAAARAEDRALDAQVRRYASLLLLAHGYHAHYRAWRKRRPMARKKPPPAALPPRPAADDTSDAAWHALKTRCNRADAADADVRQLRRLMVQYPERWRLSLGLDAALEGITTRKTDAPGRDGESAMGAWVDIRRAELGYAAADPVVRPLLDHLILCEVRLADAEGKAEQLGRGSHPIYEGDFATRQLDAAQKRYLRALETLRRVTSIRIELSETNDQTTRTVAIESPPRKD